MGSGPRNPRYYNLRSAANVLGISRQRLYVLISQKQIHVSQIVGLGRVIGAEELDRFMQTRRERQPKKVKDIAPNSKTARAPSPRSRSVAAASPALTELKQPAIGFPEFLPLHDANFSWERFEAFCEDLISHLPGMRDTHRFGRRGSKQHGIDIIATADNGKRWGVQCRRWKEFNGGHVKKAIEGTSYPADHYILMVSATASSGAREACGHYKRWDLWDIGDLSRKVRDLPADVARQVVDTHFGPRWREAFLGLIGIASFVPAMEFFRPRLDPRNLFHHSHTMVGRTALLNELHAFADSDRQRVIILIGRGGIGKSKVLYEFANQFDKRHPEAILRFVVDGVPVTSPSTDELPARPIVMAVDDAHRREREDMSVLFALAQHRPHPVKLVLATRPQGLDNLRSILTQAAFDPREVVELPEIEELSRPEVEELAREVLGQRYAHLVDLLAAATWDCPLVTLIGGRLLVEETLDPKLLERHVDFRRAVLSKFRDEQLGHIGGQIDPKVCQSVLSLVASISPLRPLDKSVQLAAAEFLAIDRATFVEALGSLEKSGILLRRGHTVRIVPDVLADHILHEVCLTPQGQPTGYADRVFDAFGESSVVNVLRNLAELDWRIGQVEDQETNLLANIWTRLEAKFRLSSHSARRWMLKQIEEAAYYQPQLVFKLIEFAMRHPSEVPEDDVLGLGPDLLHAYSHDDVLHAIPEILRRISYTREYLPRCCDLLWDLGKDDHRPLNPNPKHAIRILADLARYDFDKPLAFNKLVLEAVARWMNVADVHDHIHSPLDIVEPLLTKNALSVYAKGHQFVYRPFPVSRDAVHSLRKRALDLISLCATSDRPRVVVRALASLEEALRDPVGMFNQVISDSDRGAWLPDQLDTFATVADVARNTTLPLVHLKIEEILRWHAHFSQFDEVRQSASNIIASIPRTFELRLMQALRNSYDSRPALAEGEDAPASYRRREEEIEACRRAVCEEIIGIYSEPERGFAALNDALQAIQDSGTKDAHGFLLHTLARLNPQYTVKLCELVISQPECLLGRYLGIMLIPLRVIDMECAMSIAERAFRTGSSTLCRSVANAYRAGSWLRDPGPSDFKLFDELVAHADLNIKLPVIASLADLGRTQPRLACDIALRIDVGEDTHSAEELCQIFDEKYGIPPDTLTDGELEILLNKLAHIQKIDDYHISEVLAYASARVPRAVIRLLLDRISASQGRSSRDYQPLPHVSFLHSLAGLARSKEYKDLLATIRDRALKLTPEAHFWLPKLFHEASLGYAPESLEVLAEWISSGDVERIEAASMLLRDADPDFVFRHESFVADMLLKAHAIGDDCYRNVGTNLWVSAVSGVRSGVAGEPMPQDVELREKSSLMMKKLDPGSPVYRLYESLWRHALREISEGLARDEETAV